MLCASWESQRVGRSGYQHGCRLGRDLGSGSVPSMSSGSVTMAIKHSPGIHRTASHGKSRFQWRRNLQRDTNETHSHGRTSSRRLKINYLFILERPLTCSIHGTARHTKYFRNLVDAWRKLGEANYRPARLPAWMPARIRLKPALRRTQQQVRCASIINKVLGVYSRLGLTIV